MRGDKSLKRPAPSPTFLPIVLVSQCREWASLAGGSVRPPWVLHVCVSVSVCVSLRVGLRLEGGQTNRGRDGFSKITKEGGNE